MIPNGAPVGRTPSQLIDALMKHWVCWDEHADFYLKKLAPLLVASPESGDDTEVSILRELRPQLSDNEWNTLPQFLANRRAGIVQHIESERLALEAREAFVQQEQHQLAEASARADAERRHIAARAERDRVNRGRLREASEALKRALITEIDGRLDRDYLGTDAFFESVPQDLVSRDEYELRKLTFVRRWFELASDRQARGRSIPDNEQLAAIAAVNAHVQVVARAGSGKTKTLVDRTFFLLKHCRLPPASILLLAFNRKAAIKIQRDLLGLLHEHSEREVEFEIAGRRGLRKHSQGRQTESIDVEAESIEAVASRLQVALPHVMTFHALAYAIVRPEESILYNAVEDETQGLNRTFQRVIDDHLQIPKYKNAIRELMLAHFREDWDRVVAGAYDRTSAEFLRIRRSVARDSLRGDYVKSHGEKLIANFLFEHDIPYKYERNHWWDGVNYRPDFTIFKTAKSGFIIEYFGLSGDADYDDQAAEKRRYWANKRDWALIEFSQSDIATRGNEGFNSFLKQALEERGVECHRLPEDEIWLRIRDRAIDRFTVAAVGFVSRCRKLSLSRADLRDRIDAHKGSPVEAMFLRSIQALYAAYLDRLAATGEEDFDGLLQRAATVVAGGSTTFQRKTRRGNLADVRFLAVDEFQDFSDLFFRLLQSIRGVSPDVELFCVGDAWQAINGFAGSDLRFFEDFEAHFGSSRRLYISTNYRSASSIVDAGNALMLGFGKPATAKKTTPGMVVVADAASFRSSIVEQQRFRGDIITPMVSRIVGQSLAAGLDVVLLARGNVIPWFVSATAQGQGRAGGLTGFLEVVRSLFPKHLRGQITISTAHRYKGLERSTVIVRTRLPEAIRSSIQTGFSHVCSETLRRRSQRKSAVFSMWRLRGLQNGWCSSPTGKTLRRSSLRFRMCCPWKVFDGTRIHRSEARLVG